MNIDDMFKIPAIPSGRNKRKMADTPEVAFLEKYQNDASDHKGKRRAIDQDAEDDDNARGYDAADYMGADELDVADDAEGRFFGGGLTDEQSRLLDMVDELDTDEAAEDTLTASSVKRMLLKFEKAINKNQELRMRYSSEPTKFMESEADLDEEIKGLLVLTQAPQLYPELVNLNTVASLMSLLAHENSDIMIDTVDLINEWLDEDVVAMDVQDGSEDAAQGVKVLLDSLLEHELLPLLVQNLERLNENEESDRQGIFKILSIFENVLSLDPELARRITIDTKLPQWILKRIQAKQFDSNRGYASEILAILLQNDHDVRIKFCELDAVDICLRVVAAYKRRDPELEDEEEMVENLFNALTLLLNEDKAKELFFQGEGVELMLIMLKGKTLARVKAVKVLNYAMTGETGKASAVRLVQAAGLKPLFALFMGKGNKKLKKMHKSFSEAEDEEHVMCILVSLLRHLTIPEFAVERQRLLNKFTENDHEKVDRLVELKEQYQERDDAVCQAIEREIEADGDDVEADLAEEFYLRRLDAGLFVLQRVCLVLGVLGADDAHAEIAAHVDLLLHRVGKTRSSIMGVIEEETALLADFVSLRKIAMARQS